MNKYNPGNMSHGSIGFPSGPVTVVPRSYIVNYSSNDNEDKELVRAAYQRSLRGKSEFKISQC
ncbi:hypothetical protein FRX31_031716 [Thalictrum thalictroides]|uniref:Uncharacterized protein n=1 Tax=Thalictrum thalictroides TaxID=46969 RepID=A0A7J6V1K8_THATH|nr:hypothetical protein FRX31_031716 [Thalictrum thalictroides]